MKKLLLAGLGIIVCFHLANNFIWLAQDNTMSGIDVPNHLYYQSKFHVMFKKTVLNKTDVFLFNVPGFLRLMHHPMSSDGCVYWPNLLYFSSTLFTLVFGCSLFAAKSSMSLYLVLLLFSVYGIGRKLGDRATGVLAAFFVSMYPLIFESSRQYGLDLPLTAIVCLALLLLLKTEHFSSLKYSVLLGVAAGIGMLIKGQFALFFAAPFLAILACSLKERRDKPNPRVFLNLSLFILIAALLASVWWIGRVKIAWDWLILHFSSRSRFFENTALTEMHDWKVYLYTLKVLVFDSTGIVLAAVSAVSLAAFMRSKDKLRTFFFLWIIVPLFLFSFLIVVKFDRFLMPFLPALAVISAWGIQQLRPKRVKITLMVLLALFAALQYYTLSYSKFGGNNWQRSVRNNPVFISSSYGRSFLSYPGKPYYDLEKLKITRQAVDIIAGSCGGNCKTGLVLLNNKFGPFEALYWMYHFNRRVRVIDWVGDYSVFYRELPDFEYVIVSADYRQNLIWPVDKQFLSFPHQLGAPNFRLVETLSGWEDNFKRLVQAKDDFKLISTLEAGDGIFWYIHKRKEKNER